MKSRQIYESFSTSCLPRFRGRTLGMDLSVDLNTYAYRREGILVWGVIDLVPKWLKIETIKVLRVI